MSLANWFKWLFKKEEVRLPDGKVHESMPPNSPVVEVPPIPQHEKMPWQDKYQHLDPTHIVPRQALQLALNYFDEHQSVFPNKKYISVVDYNQHCSKKRFYIIDMKTGQVENHCVAHGKYSDPDNDGYCTSFSNVPGSNQSSLGLVKTGEIYSGNHSHSMRLDGLSKTNSNMRARYVVLHECSYVNDGAAHNGRSEGCLAVDDKYSRSIVDKLANGSLILLWHNSFKAV